MANAVIIQSGGMTPVINATLIGFVKEAREVFDKVYGAKYGVFGLEKGDLLCLSDMSEDILDRISHVPSGFLGSSRKKIDIKSADEIFRNTIEKHNIEGVFMIGGNDTAYNVRFLSDYMKDKGKDISVIGLPKTIDNDLFGMYFCPGYPSVAKYIAISVQEAGLDTLSMRYSDPIKIIEVMGRNAGWLVGSAAALKRKDVQPPHLLCFPEIGLDVDVFVERVKQIYEEIGFVVVVLSENVKDKSGRKIGEKVSGISCDGFGHSYVESPAQRLCNIIEERLCVRARWDKPGTLQRMSRVYVSDVDWQVAYDCGRYAVSLFSEGKSGVEVVVKRDGLGFCNVDDIAAREYILPKEYIRDDGFFVTDSFIDYLLPLLGKDLPDYSWIY